MKFSFQNIVRNVWLSATALVIITLSLFALTSLYLINIVGKESINAIKDKVDVSLYFKPEVSREQILKVEQDLQGLREVKDIVYISKEESLEKLRKKFAANTAVIESLAELESNPLGDTLLIKAQDTDDYEKILDYIGSQKKYSALVQYKNFDDNQVIIERITQLSGKVGRMALLVSVIFVAIIVLVLINSLRVTIYSHREEIGIMRLVGATNWFIRGPFWIESVIFVLIASIATIAALFPIVNSADPYISSLFGNYRFHLMDFYKNNFIGLWFKLFAGGTILSVFSTSLAMRKYLRV